MNASNSNYKKEEPSIPCFCIPGLQNLEAVKSLLDRVMREFVPIIRNRGFNVLSVSEMCCCNDGLDFKEGRRRKLRKMNNNVWGYNQTTFHRGKQLKSHTIHLRLRHAQDHTRLLSYEDVAGTMAHELAHCVHSPHNKAFYALMDEILEQHAVLMASGLKAQNGDPMLAFGGAGYRLGGNIEKTVSTNEPPASKPFGGGTQGRRLGGDTVFTQWMSPRDAAVMSAMMRQRQKQLRLRGDRCCRPCLVDLVNNTEEYIDPSPLKQKRRRVEKPQVIDLTVGDSEDDVEVESKSTWECQFCTLLNETKETSCQACSTPKP